MSSQDFSPAAYSLYAEDGTQDSGAPPVTRSQERYWLYCLLFGLTLLTTTLVGAAMQLDFNRGVPFDIEHSFELYGLFWRHPGSLLRGLPFSLSLMAILLAARVPFGRWLRFASGALVLLLLIGIASLAIAR